MNKGLSLTELIVASVIAMLILLGIASSNIFLERNRHGYGKLYSIESNTTATLNHILRNAGMAIGSGSATDKGILAGAAETGDADTLCIHQDVNNTPDDATDDRWVCYTIANSALYSCIHAYDAAIALRGADKCSSSDEFVGTVANSDPTLTDSPTLSSFDIDGDGSLFDITSNKFSIKIYNRFKPDEAADSETNPQVEREGSVSPSGHSI